MIFYYSSDNAPFIRVLQLQMINNHRLLNLDRYTGLMHFSGNLLLLYPVPNTFSRF